MPSKKRYYDIDLAKCIPLLCLPFVHVMEYWGYRCGGADILQHNAADLLSSIVDFQLIFGAPAFMVCMGMSMLFSSKTTAGMMAKRGLSLLILEFVLNLIRYALPALVGVLIGGQGPDTEDVINMALYGQMNSDIFAFAGLAFLAIALMKKLKFSPEAMFGTAVLLSFANEAIIALAGDWINANVNSNLCNLLGNFFYINEDSTFPFMEWLIFPTLGMCFSKRLLAAEKRGNGVEKLWNTWGLTAVVLTCVILAVLLVQGRNLIDAFYGCVLSNHVSPLSGFVQAVATIDFMYIVHIVWRLLRLDDSPKAVKVVSFISVNITFYYCVQWILVGWGLFLSGGLHYWGCQTINTFWALTASVLIMIVAFITAPWLRKRIKI